MLRRVFPVALAALSIAIGVWPAATAANLHGGNGVYRVVVSDGQQSFKCGTWVAVTGALHPAGPGRDLIFSSNHTPINTSYTTLHSYGTGRDYTTTFVCTALCDYAGQPVIEPIEREGTTVGQRLSWTFEDGFPGQFPGPSVIRFVQEVLVEGPVDGTETSDNSVVRETHRVENLGPGLFRFGLRKFWDVNIDSDPAPWLGDCRSPEAGCDRSLNLQPASFLPAFMLRNPVFPDSVILRANPPVAACPPPIAPNAPAGCKGPDPWVVAATVRGSNDLDPAADPPDVLQFNLWNIQFGACFSADLLDGVECGSGALYDDSSMAYMYGVTPQSAIRLGAGESRSFTQYLALDLDSCPDIITGD